MKERRKYARRRTTLSGTILSNNASVVITCIIRDLSAEGASLDVASIATVPETFDLLIDTKNEGIQRRRCKVTWKAENRLGASFY